MDHGVRQIAILADDAGDQGKDLYIKLCKEMTDCCTSSRRPRTPTARSSTPASRTRSSSAP